MKARPVALALIVALAPASVAVAPTCQAQTVAGADDATTTMARARFKEGVEYYDKGQYELARAAFLQAYALKKHPAVLLNLAWSCLKSGHTAEAERYFKQFLSESSEISDKQRADANDGLAQSRAKLGRIDVTAPAGTEVSVDGESVGVAPLPDGAAVEPGTHAVKMRAPDGTTDTENVTVAAGARGVAHFTKAPVASPPGPTGAVPAQPPPPAQSAALAQPAPSPPAEEPTSHPVPVGPSPSTAPAGAVSEAPAKPSESRKLPLYPVVIGAVATVAGVGLAIGFKISRDTAQNNANNTASQIAAYEESHNISPVRCSSSASMPALPSTVTRACANWYANNDDVNKDATVATTAAIAGAVLGAFTIGYAIAYATSGHDRAASRAPMITPILGPSLAGLSLSSSF